jgi:hypothetical protein
MKGPCKVVCLLVLVALGVRAHVEREQAVLDAAGEADVDNGVSNRAEMELAMRLGNRLHHKWGLWGFPNDKVHEDIVNTAFGMLSATEKAVFDQAMFTTGVRFPDMPTTTANNYLDGAAFAADFKLPSHRRQLVYNSHYGCLQHWHAQGSVMVGPTLELPNGAGRYVFTNTELKGFMMSQAALWWTKACTSSKATRTFNLGRLLHIVHDSFPRGHTLRDETNSYPYNNGGDPFDPEGKGKTMATGCGKIWYFQGYDAQDGNHQHAAADKMPTTAHTDYKRLQCAKYYSWKLMSLLAKCGNSGTGSACAWSQAARILDEVWQLASWAAGRKTAGAVAAFAASGLGSKGFQLVNYPAPVSTGVWEPTSAKLWSSATGYQKLCPPIVGKSASIPYTETAFTDFYNPTKGTAPSGPLTMAPCYRSKTNGAIFYGHLSGDCKCSNMIMTCKKSAECKPASQGCSGQCRCQEMLPGDTCRCVVPHPGYPVVCNTESYGNLY